MAAVVATVVATVAATVATTAAPTSTVGENTRTAIYHELCNIETKSSPATDADDDANANAVPLHEQWLHSMTQMHWQRQHMLLLIALVVVVILQW